jgi:hypothetical protein
VKRNNAGIRPKHRVLTQNIRPEGIFWECRLGKGHVVWLGVRPTFVKRRMPKGKVFQSENLPHSVLLDVLVLVHTSLPPLYQAARVGVLDAFVCAGGHHTAETALCPSAVCIDIDYALHLRVVEEKAVNGAVATSHKHLSETADVEALNARFAIVATSKKFNAGVRVV